MLLHFCYFDQWQRLFPNRLFGEVLFSVRLSPLNAAHNPIARYEVPYTVQIPYKIFRLVLSEAMNNTYATSSPEALRSLGSSRLSSSALFVTASEATKVDHPLLCHSDMNTSETQNNTYGARRKGPTPPHGLFTFKVTSDKGRNPKRTKFEDPKRRAEVAQIREEGGCMRCHRKKIPVHQMLPNRIS